jgi:hypothetical protein
MQDEVFIDVFIKNIKPKKFLGQCRPKWQKPQNKIAPYTPTPTVYVTHISTGREFFK